MGEKNNKKLIILLIAIVLVIAVVACLFATGIIKLNNISTEPQNTKTVKAVVLKEGYVEFDDKKPLTADVEKTINQITVKVVKPTKDDGDYGLLINGKDISTDVLTRVYSYEIYENNVIVLSGNTGGKCITIFKIDGDNVETVYKEGIIENYRIKSYILDENKLLIEGTECGEQCGVESTEYASASFEMEYTNGKFTDPKLVNKRASKLVDVSGEGIVEETITTEFKGVKVVVEPKTNDTMDDNYKLTINGVDVTENVYNMYIYYYEIYENYVIVHTGTTNNGCVTIFKVTDNEVEKTFKETMIENYRINGFKTTANRILINGTECGAQCGEESTGYLHALFEMKYENNTFSSPKLVIKSVN